MTSVRREKPVGTRLQSGYEHGNVGLVPNQMAVTIDFLLGREGNELRIYETQQRAISVYGVVG
jgi:hypothetical protein